MTMARVSKDGSVKVKSIRGDQFKQVPRLANSDQVTLQEEDKIAAFYGGGTLYAMPDRMGPLL
jgi:photosynthetic reaction center H subunit